MKELCLLSQAMSQRNQLRDQLEEFSRNATEFQEALRNRIVDLEAELAKYRDKYPIHGTVKLDVLDCARKLVEAEEKIQWLKKANASLVAINDSQRETLANIKIILLAFKFERIDQETA